MLHVYSLFCSCTVALNVGLLRFFFFFFSAHVTGADWLLGFSVSGTLVANIMIGLISFLRVIWF